MTNKAVAGGCVLAEHGVEGRSKLVSYQIGSGATPNGDTVIVYSRGAYLDLNAVLAGPQGEEDAVTLAQILEDWSSWKKRLPDVVDDAFARDDGHGPLGVVEGEKVRWLPPVAYPRKLICIGTNYKDHIAEMGIDTLPKYPYAFLKPATTTLIGSGEALTLPEQSKMVDWEAELAVIIGRRVRGVRGDEAMAAVAGYAPLNDVSARDWISEPTLVGIDWVMQKAFDGFTPIGPLMTPAEFVPDPDNLPISLSVNGEVKQDSTTANMVFSVQEIVEHLAAIMTLEPGDVIATGTPAGVGYGMKPRQFLKPGDHMTVEIEGLGNLETYVE